MNPVIRIFFSIAISSCLFLNSCSKKPDTGLLVSQIKCIGLENPAGTGPFPDFSWILTASHRGQIQAAYQIIVGSDSELFKTNPILSGIQVRHSLKNLPGLNTGDPPWQMLKSISGEYGYGMRMTNHQSGVKQENLLRVYLKKKIGKMRDG